MAYTVSVTWIAKEGEEEAVASALQLLVEPSRAEPGGRPVSTALLFLPRP